MRSCTRRVASMVRVGRGDVAEGLALDRDALAVEQGLVVAAASETYCEEARPRPDRVALIGRSSLLRTQQLARQALDFFTAAKVGVWEARARALLEGLDPRVVARRS